MHIVAAHVGLVWKLSGHQTLRLIMILVTLFYNDASFHRWASCYVKNLITYTEAESWILTISAHYE